MFTEKVLIRFVTYMGCPSYLSIETQLPFAFDHNHIPMKHTMSKTAHRRNQNDMNKTRHLGIVTSFQTYGASIDSVFSYIQVVYHGIYSQKGIDINPPTSECSQPVMRICLLKQQNFVSRWHEPTYSAVHSPRRGHSSEKTCVQFFSG